MRGVMCELHILYCADYIWVPCKTFSGILGLTMSISPPSLIRTDPVCLRNHSIPYAHAWADVNLPPPPPLFFFDKCMSPINLARLKCYNISILLVPNITEHRSNMRVTSSEKCLRGFCGFTWSCTCAKSHPGIYSLLKHSFCGQRRPWSDCANAQTDLGLGCPHMAEDTFSHSMTPSIYLNTS